MGPVLHPPTPIARKEICHSERSEESLILFCRARESTWVAHVSVFETWGSSAPSFGPTLATSSKTPPAQLSDVERIGRSRAWTGGPIWSPAHSQRATRICQSERSEESLILFYWFLELLSIRTPLPSNSKSSTMR